MSPLNVIILPTIILTSMEDFKMIQVLPNLIVDVKQLFN